MARVRKELAHYMETSDLVPFQTSLEHNEEMALLMATIVAAYFPQVARVSGVGGDLLVELSLSPARSALRFSSLISMTHSSFPFPRAARALRPNTKGRWCVFHS